MNPIEKYEITSVRTIAESTKVYRMKPLGNRIEYRPGQFLFLHLDGIKRPYSVASSPDDQELEFCIKLIGGEFTSKLADVKAGDIIGVQLGGGHFTFEGEKKAAFIAGGTGIAPIMSILRTIAGENIEGEFVFFYSSKTRDSILYRDELEDLCQKNPSIKIIHTLTREEWDGEKGRIDAAMIGRHIENPQEFSFWICGPLVMIRAMREHLSRIGADMKKLKLEGWG